jgi:hypothetical protein
MSMMHSMDTKADRVVRLHAERRALRAEGVPSTALERNRRKLLAAHRALRQELDGRPRAA